MTPHSDTHNSQPQIERESIVEWMKLNDWAATSSGVGGELWKSTKIEGAEIGIPFGPLDDFSIESISKRLARWNGVNQSTLLDTLATYMVDVSRFIADVPLNYAAGKPGAELRIVSHLFGGTGKIFRAAARTSRSTTQVIGSNFNQLDETTFSNAIAGMTEIGSYALPVYVPVGSPDTDGSIGLAAPSQSRQLTSTVANALHAIEEHVITPAKMDVTDDVIREMVSKGVSKELLTAVSELITVDGTDAKTSFSWAPSHAQVPGASKLPTEVEIPHEARGLVDQVADRFKSSPQKRREFVGQVRGILLGETAEEVISIVAVPRAGSSNDESAPLSSTVEVTHRQVSDKFRDELYRFMSEGTKVEFTGVVEKVSNRRRISNPLNFRERPQQIDLNNQD